MLEDGWQITTHHSSYMHTYTHPLTDTDTQTHRHTHEHRHRHTHRHRRTCTHTLCCIESKDSCPHSIKDELHLTHDRSVKVLPQPWLYHTIKLLPCLQQPKQKEGWRFTSNMPLSCMQDGCMPECIQLFWVSSVQYPELMNWPAALCLYVQTV